MKAYYTQEKIASSLREFLNKISSIFKPHLNIITAMICAESVVTSDLPKKLKDDFSLVHLESTERRFRRFFNSFSSPFYYSFISSIISKFCVKHSDNKIHISFDTCFAKTNLLFFFFPYVLANKVFFLGLGVLKVNTIPMLII